MLLLDLINQDRFGSSLSKRIEYYRGWNCYKEEHIQQDKSNEECIDINWASDCDQLVVWISIIRWHNIHDKDNLSETTIVFCIIIIFCAFRNFDDLICYYSKTNNDQGVKKDVNGDIFIATNNGLKCLPWCRVVKER